MHPLNQAPVLEKVAPPQGKGGGDDVAPAGDNNPVPPERKGAKVMISGYDIFKGLFLGDN